MAETPMDIIMKHLSAEREYVEQGNSPTDTISLAIALNEDLKQNFRIVALAEPWETNSEPAPSPTALTFPEGAAEITVHATGNPMLFYFGTDKQVRRLDELLPGTRFPLRERQIALALTDLGASTLRDQTL